MTKDKARKNATRQRKAETGERYVVARRRSTDEYSWLRCANCDTTLDVRIEGLFCSELCRQTADLVRYARRKVQQGQVDDPDIAWALQIRMALLLGGGYPGPERRLSRATRDAVIERDQVEVVPNLVGFGGGPPPDACQLVGVRASTKTHERKGTTTYDEEKATPRAGPEA